MLWKLLAVTLLAIGLTTAIACGDDDDDDDDTGGEPTAAETTAPADETDDADETVEPTETDEATDEPDDGEPMTVELNAADFAFNRSTISAPAGSEVTVDFANVGEAPHTFTVTELDVNEELAGGGSTTFTFTMPDQDTEFFCAVHPSLMIGTLQPVDGDSAANPQNSQSPSVADTRY